MEKILEITTAIMVFIIYSLSVYILAFLGQYIIYNLFSQQGFDDLVQQIFLTPFIVFIPLVLAYFILKKIGFEKSTSFLFLFIYVIVFVIIYMFWYDYQNEVGGLQYKIINQKEIGMIQTGDVVQLSWKGCNNSSNNFSLELDHEPYSPLNANIEITNKLKDHNYNWQIPSSIYDDEYSFLLSSNCGKARSKTMAIKQVIH